MVTTDRRRDTAVRVSKWLDREVERLLDDRRVKLEYPSKRNFVDTAILRLLEEKGVKIDK
jgi:hypothetical protein